MPDASASAAAAVAVVGPERVGKTALALALGAVPTNAHDDNHQVAGFTWGRRPLEIIGGRRRRLAAKHAAALVVFDLTRKESLNAALAQVRSRARA